MNYSFSGPGNAGTLCQPARLLRETCREGRVLTRFVWYRRFSGYHKKKKTLPLTWFSGRR